MFEIILSITVFGALGAEASDDVLLIAHRGGVVDQQRIENNVPAIQEAMQRGYWMLEVDIRESKDGHLVVHHDENFERFYGDPRKVAELTWEEMKQLKSHPGGLRPIDFAEFAKACKGSIRLMLDTKGPRHSDEFFKTMVRILRENELLRSAFIIGTDQSKKLLHGRAKIGMNREELAMAAGRGERVAQLYFLFEHGNDLDARTIEFARKHGVVVVPSVNVFHYPSENHETLAAADIHRLRKLGVKYFQIDSVYEKYCRD